MRLCKVFRPLQEALLSKNILIHMQTGDEGSTMNETTRARTITAATSTYFQQYLCSRRRITMRLINCNQSEPNPTLEKLFGIVTSVLRKSFSTKLIVRNEKRQTGKQIIFFILILTTGMFGIMRATLDNAFARAHFSLKAFTFDQRF